MSAYIRLKGRYFMINNTLPICAITFISIFIRRILPSATILAAYSYLTSNAYSNLLTRYNNAVIYLITAFVFIFTALLLLYLCAGVKLLEYHTFINTVKHGRPLAKSVLGRITFYKISRSLWLYGKINTFKLGWFIYFFSAPAVCTAVMVYLYNNSSLTLPVFLIIFPVNIILYALSFSMWRNAVCRYCAAPFYFWEDFACSIPDAINRSIENTDGTLTKNLFLEYSFTGWFLSCAVILPLFYVIPYYKISKAVFMQDEIFTSAHPYAPE